MEKEFVESDGEKIYFHIQRKNIKNMNLKVDFSGFSNEKTTISSNDSQTVQASNVNGAQ